MKPKRKVTYNPKSAWNKGKGFGITWLRAHVDYSLDHCLTWPLSCDDKGHAIIGVDGKRHKAARYMCELAHGPPPLGYECAHSCGRGHRGCVNPRHLSWKTRSGNQQDRRRHGTQGTPGVAGRSKLLPAQIAQIQALKGKKTQTELARQFNCSPSNISKIHNGARWKKTPNWINGITADDLGAIRAAKGSRQLADLAAQYGVSSSVIWRIQSGRYTYAHIAGASLSDGDGEGVRADD
jgi:hypothetical protein